MDDRRQTAHRIRTEAAELASARSHPNHQANGDEQRFASANYAMSFTKGLPHSEEHGLVKDAEDFEAFRAAIDEGYIDAFTDKVPSGWPVEEERRQWEAPTAGVVGDLQGPDAQAVTMPPAPPLVGDDGKVNPELVFEMAEVYDLALIRDVPLNKFEDGAETQEITDSIGRLNGLDYAQQGFSNRPRKVGDQGSLTPQTLHRGSSPGVENGPYLSQFMMIGNRDITGEGGDVTDGRIQYGPLVVDQRVPVAKPRQDYMQTYEAWLEVQNGKNTRKDGELYLEDGARVAQRRFIATPRDLATYVHVDALYQAYLNACLILLGMDAPPDPAFGNLSGKGKLVGKRRNAGGFALYGGPHILTLVTEVATRALKAVRFQKFNNHIRLRPEALAARIALFERIGDRFPTVGDQFKDFRDALGELVELVERHNDDSGGDRAAFLPMAFQEGSPMHPAYGAGHATVAGACVTILKAYFDTDAVLVKSDDGIVFKRYERGDQKVAFRTNDEGTALIGFEPDTFLTLEGELNKLAANISIGRNMAGVHYFSDYYDSLRMGEEIAIGILEEQAVCYPTDPFVMSVPTFDGEVRRIGRR